MFGSILFRMTMWELCKVFVIALVGITGILLMAGIIAEAQSQGFGPAQLLKAIPLIIPSTLPYTIPATTLFTACVVYGRLSADNEILAIKASGVNILHIVKPGLVLGMGMSLGTTALYYHVIPHTHLLLRSMVFDDCEELLYSMLKKNGSMSLPQLKYSMFVKGVQGRKLVSPVFKRRNADGTIGMVVHAREADMHVNMLKKELQIHMRRGVIITSDGSLDGDFDDKWFNIELPPGFGKNDNVRPRDMTWQVLLSRQAELGQEIEAAAEEAAAAEARPAGEVDPIIWPVHVKHLQEKHKQLQYQARLIVVEMLMRPALSLGCFCFILVGCPIGIMFSRGDYLGAFITCFLPIVLIYYPLLLAGTNMANKGRFNEVLLVFAADIVIALCGLPLFRSLLKN
jgi:lipopolysaccharide export system permease protein